MTHKEDIRSLYQLFGLQPNASKQAIRKAYLTLALKYHPDKNYTKKAKLLFQEIGNIYEKLLDDVNKKECDRELNDAQEVTTEEYYNEMEFVTNMIYVLSMLCDPELIYTYDIRIETNQLFFIDTKMTQTSQHKKELIKILQDCQTLLSWEESASKNTKKIFFYSEDIKEFQKLWAKNLCLTLDDYLFMVAIPPEEELRQEHYDILTSMLLRFTSVVKQERTKSADQKEATSDASGNTAQNPDRVSEENKKYKPSNTDNKPQTASVPVADPRTPESVSFSQPYMFQANRAQEENGNISTNPLYIVIDVFLNILRTISDAIKNIIRVLNCTTGAKDDNNELDDDHIRNTPRL